MNKLLQNKVTEPVLVGCGILLLVFIIILYKRIQAIGFDIAVNQASIESELVQ